MRYSAHSNIGLWLRTLLFASLCLGGAHAHAKITIKSISGASVVENLNTTLPSTGNGTTTTSAIPVVYGGSAGESNVGGCASPSSDSTCDNCISGTGDAGLLMCNNNRIHPNLRLAITYSSDSVAGVPQVVNGSSTTSTGTSLTLDSGSTTGSVAKGTDVTVYVRWATLCTEFITSAITGGVAATCTAGSAAQGSLKVGISTTGSGLGASDDSTQVNLVIMSSITNSSGSSASANGTTGTSPSALCPANATDGLCYFEIKPGDEKVSVARVVGPTNFPNGLIPYRKVRIYYSDVGFSSINPASKHEDLSIDGTDTTSFSVSPKRVNGLKNGTTYYFKAASVDAAGNVGFYTQSADDNACYTTGTTSYYYPCGSSTSSCSATQIAQIPHCHIATPAEVYGVLEKSECFIATASYGSSMAKEVDTFRAFRNQILVEKSWGKRFIKFYYRHSPKLAAYIAGSPPLRALSRAALWPFWALARLSLTIGWSLALPLWLLAFSIPPSVILFYRRLFYRRRKGVKNA